MAQSNNSGTTQPPRFISSIKSEKLESKNEQPMKISSLNNNTSKKKGKGAKGTSKQTKNEHKEEPETREHESEAKATLDVTDTITEDATIDCGGTLDP